MGPVRKRKKSKSDPGERDSGIVHGKRRIDFKTGEEESEKKKDNLGRVHRVANPAQKRKVREKAQNPRKKRLTPLRNRRNTAST